MKKNISANLRTPPLYSKSLSKTAIFFLSFCLFSQSIVASAQVHHHHTVAIPNNLEVANEYYDASVGGIEDYMENLQESDPATYKKLLPHLNRLQSKRTTAYLVAVPLMVAGAVLTVGAFTFMQVDTWPAGSSGASAFPGSKSPNMAAALGGMGLEIAGVVLAMIIYPGRTDLMNFLNKNNQANPKNPMHWQLGFDMPTQNSLAGTLAFRF